MSTGYNIRINGTDYDIYNFFADNNHGLNFSDDATGGVITGMQNYNFTSGGVGPVYSVDTSDDTAMRGSTGGAYNNNDSVVNGDFLTANNIIGKFYLYDETNSTLNTEIDVTIPSWARSFRAIVIGAGGGSGGSGWTYTHSGYGGGGGGQGELAIFDFSNIDSTNDTLKYSVGNGGAGGPKGGDSTGPGDDGDTGENSYILVNGWQSLANSGEGGGGSGDHSGSPGPGGAGGGTGSSSSSNGPGLVISVLGQNGHTAGGRTGAAGGIGENGGTGGTDKMVRYIDNRSWSWSGYGWGKGAPGPDAHPTSTVLGVPVAQVGRSGNRGDPGAVILIFYPATSPPTLKIL